VTKKRRGPFGWIVNRIALGLTNVVGTYFGDGDTKVFESIKWNFKNPIKADRSILHFNRHLAQQKRVAWGAWDGDATASAIHTPKGRADA
jgi:hypothetical protein